MTHFVKTEFWQKAYRILGGVVSMGVLAADAAAQSDQVSPKTSDAELVKQLSNPVASLISVPFQNNFDFNLGTRLWAERSGYDRQMEAARDDAC